MTGHVPVERDEDYDLDMQPFRELKKVDPEAFEVVKLIAERVADGSKHYGKLDLSNDNRDPVKEAGEEIADGLFYAGVAMVKAKLSKK